MLAGRFGCFSRTWPIASVKCLKLQFASLLRPGSTKELSIKQTPIQSQTKLCQLMLKEQRKQSLEGKFELRVYGTPNSERNARTTVSRCHNPDPALGNHLELLHLTFSHKTTQTSHERRPKQTRPNMFLPRLLVDAARIRRLKAP